MALASAVPWLGCATASGGRPATGATATPAAARPATPTSTSAPKAASAATIPQAATTTALAATPPAHPEARSGLDIKFVRDSREYQALTRQAYRMATDAMRVASIQAPAGQVWAAVLDVDETALDNSTYQLERAAYGLPYDNDSWNAWVRRGAAGVVPGVVEFIAAVRETGGRVAWITNRDDEVRDATRENLRRAGLWQDDDRLCLATPDRDYNKAARRKELQSGTGACAWTGTAVSVVVYLGDQMGDFPIEAEPGADAADAKFGRQFFILPNPMYGGWVSRVTRR